MSHKSAPPGTYAAQGLYDQLLGRVFSDIPDLQRMFTMQALGQQSALKSDYMAGRQQTLSNLAGRGLMASGLGSALETQGRVGYTMAHGQLATQSEFDRAQFLEQLISGRFSQAMQALGILRGVPVQQSGGWLGQNLPYFQLLSQNLGGGQGGQMMGGLFSAIGAKSSRKLKKNLRSLGSKDARKILLALRPRRFQWKHGSIEDIGFVAEETKSADGTIYTEVAGQGMVNFLPILAALVGVVQDLSKKVERMESENGERNHRLRSRP